MESRGSSDQEDDRIVQVREALMSPDGENFEGLRTARFLNYSTTSINDDVFELPLDAFAYRSEAIDPEEWTAKISFSGWRSPLANWNEWVDTMAESHAAAWRQSGVYDAIMASRYQTKKQDALIMALVERWCIETNTFVFPWGEATVTLEDMIVLGGFSVIGNNALAPIKRADMKEVEEKMKKAKRFIESKLEKKKCSVSSWMKEMMNNSGNEIEHEAFMVSWLSRFVFPNTSDLVKERLFPAAIQLTKGVKVALAPAVLARIYYDLGLLKENLAGYSEKDMVEVNSPFHFVQIWALERFMELQPPGQPGQLKSGEPRIARWHHHGGECDHPEDIRVVLDSGKESFDYRPYTKPLSNFKFPKFYLEDDCWVRVRPDESIAAFARCLRFAKLVGPDCIEPYYPHRVALQFGYDQDIPDMVPARVETPELAWKDYIRPIGDGMLYVPARLHEADVTVGYVRWWKLTVATLQSEAKRIPLPSPPKHKLVNTSGEDKVVKKREVETNRGNSVTGSWIEANRAHGQSHDYTGSHTGSEKVSRQPLKMHEWVQRPSPRSIKSSVDDVKDLKGVLRDSGGTKSQGHVTFQLSSSARRSPFRAHTYSPRKTDSQAKKPRIRVPDKAKESGSLTRVRRHTSSSPSRRESYRVSKESNMSPTFSDSPIKKKVSPKYSEPVNSRGQRNSPIPRLSKEPYKPRRSHEVVDLCDQKHSPSQRDSKGVYKSSSSSFSCSPSSARKKSPRSHETVTSLGNNSSLSPRVSKELNKSQSLPSPRKKPPRSSETVDSYGTSATGGNYVGKGNSDGSITLGKQSTQLDIGKRNSVKCVEEIVTLRKQVSKEGEETYQIPKQQFEDLSQGVHDVLHDLQSIKLALNIQNDDDDDA